jgi:hypothetical protein
MMPATRPDVDAILTHVAESLDISPTDYERAVRSYGAVGKWLKDGFQNGAYPESAEEPSIYPQGSINLGTIVRPIKEGKESDFDVDLVCKLRVSPTAMSPEVTKGEVGNRLKENDTYREKLDSEGKRCWTLTYAESEGVGFHLDILPCLPSLSEDHPGYPGAISLTNKDKAAGTYVWKPGNPKGYGQWFRDQNVIFEKLTHQQKQSIFEQVRSRQPGMLKYKSIDDVPDQLVRTPLQRAIQLMKRHRDVRFAKKPGHKPISIIITTLAAHLYQEETDVYAALTNITDLLAIHGDLLANRYAALDEKVADMKLITRNDDGEWHIPNPVNSGENFADRWHEEHDARARAFFQWVQWLKEDVTAVLEAGTDEDLNEQLQRVFGKRVASSVIEKLQPPTPKTSLVTRIGKATLSLFSVSWRQQPGWPMRVVQEFDIGARLSKHNGFRPYAFHYGSGSQCLNKHLTIRFAAPSFGADCDYYWQVTNTGDEARRAGDLRGGFQMDGEIHTETTKYTGDHCVQCFVVKDGMCIARSHEFEVRIK